MITSDKAAIRAVAEQIAASFLAANAMPVEADILQPAETLLDLYGEDIRARAYVTNDPLRGELMMRPDFTVPVVQLHMETGAEPARYTYLGEVFRKQDHETGRANEYLQVGFELFDPTDTAAADAEVFALFQQALSPFDLGLRAATGDIGILLAVVDSLSTTDRRRAALRRHLWRPRRFRALLDRFGGRRPAPESRVKLLDAVGTSGVEAILDQAGPEIGLRSREDVAARVAALIDDAAQDPLSAGELEIMNHILSIRETSDNALEQLRDVAVDMPAIEPAVAQLGRRLDALSARGVDVSELDFEASYGRTTLEYYDGFVFGFYAADRPDLPSVATGGRYDALTRVLGGGRSIPAVGGVARPEVITTLQEARS